MKKRWRQAALIALLWGGAADSAFALNRDRALSQLHHTVWTEREGVPTGIQALAQTDDGYLWLATANGLFQFDGVRFQRPAVTSGVLPSGSIVNLKAVPSGGLWIGWLFGGATFFSHGVATNYGAQEGLPPGTVYGFAADPSGTLWAGTSAGLRRFDGRRWDPLGPDWGIPGAPARALFIDSSGTLAVATPETVFLLPRGARKFVATGGNVLVPFGFVRTPDGTIYCSEARGIRAISSLSSYAVVDQPWVVRTSISLGLYADHDGALWIGTPRNGVQRIRFPERVPPAGAAAAIETFSRSDGLSDDATSDIFEDREGSIWVATHGGLDRFRENSVVPLLTTSVADVPTVAAADAGGVWVGTLGTWSLAKADGTLLQQRLPDGTGTTAAYQEGDHILWVGRADQDGRASLIRVTADQNSTIPLPQGIAVGSQIQAISKDPGGALWISVQRTGVFRQTGSGWEMVSILPQNGRLAAIGMLDDSSGRKWFGYPRNRLVSLQGGVAQEYSQRDGLAVGNVLALHARGSDVWIGGDDGLAVFGSGRIRSILAEDPDVLKGVAGIVEAANGDLWLNASRGVVLLSTSETQKALSQADYRVNPRVFDSRDGLSGAPPTVRPLPGAIKGTDGRIWFTRTRGVFWVDPEKLVHNSLAPSVAVLSLTVDGRHYDGSSHPTLPIGSSNLEISYTATSLVVPERVQFRYRLDGVDDRWQDAGARRTAYYTNLRPGAYRFHVIASNNDGVWNDVGATQSFTVPPAFFQTTWFATAVVLIALTGVGAAYKWRVRQISERTRGLLQQRLIERERIARELHDTLLQSTEGLILKLHAAAQQIPPSEPTRQLLERALDGADAVIAEGRDRVRDLRVAKRAADDLADALAEAARRLGDGRFGRFSAVVQGTARALHPIVHEELYSICREALANAYLHAEASAIDVELTYGRDELRIRVRDDGVGIDTEILRVGSRADHWGLSGMRERADRIGAKLEIWSRPGAGTHVELRLAGATAYSQKESLERGGRS